MILPKYMLQFSRQYITRCNLLQSHITPIYCALHRKYSSDLPRKFSDRHEWVTFEEDQGTVGITKYAQESLGDIVFAQLPSAGATIAAGDECGALESVKAASEIYSPVSGTITEKNPNVENKPALINTNCYDDGWLFKITLSKPEELEQLMTEEEYEKFLQTDVEKEV